MVISSQWMQTKLPPFVNLLNKKKSQKNWHLFFSFWFKSKLYCMRQNELHPLQTRQRKNKSV